MPILPHHSLAISLLAAAASIAPLRGQIPTEAIPDDPLAVLAAKVAEAPKAHHRFVRIGYADGKPAPDALVVFVPASASVDERSMDRLASERWPRDRVRQLAMQALDGVRLQVDDRSRFRVPGDGRVFAFAGDHATTYFVGAGTSVVRLIPAPTCTVEVVDEAGQPVANAPLAVRATGGILPSGQLIGTYGGLLLSQHSTNGDGRCTLRLLVPDPNAATIGLRIASDAPITAPLPASGGHVRLTMPKTTTLTATFVGELTPRRALSFRLQCRSPEQPIPGESMGERSAVWPFVAIGTEVTVTLDLVAPGPAGTVASARVATTAIANAPPLELGAMFTHANVVLQVLDLAGQPTPHRDFTLRIEQGDARRLRRVRADAEGWVELSLPNGAADAAPATIELDLHADAPAETARAIAAGELTLTALQSPGPKVGCARVEVRPRGPFRQRLEPIRCQPMPVLSAGRLVLPDGKVPLSTITMTTEDGVRVRTDEAGRFELRGEARDADRDFERPPPSDEEARSDEEHGSSATRVEIERTWCFGGDSPWSVELAHGAVDDRIVVERTRALPLHPELATPDLVAFAFRLEPSGRRGRRVPVEIDGRERKLPLPNGAWHLVAHAGVLDLARWEDVCTDDRDTPRIASLDWRPFARLVELRVVDRAGRPLDDCIVRLREEETSCAPKDGLVRILVPFDGANVDVWYPIGHRMALDLLDENRTVVFDDRPRLQVKLRPVPKLPAGVVLELAIGGGDPVAFDERGSAMAVVTGEGTFTPTIRLRKDGAASAPLAWQLPHLFMPKDGAPIPIRITLERRSVLEAAVAELRDR